MDNKEKNNIKLRLAASFRTILKEKKSKGLENKANNIEDLRLIDSMRQLEADSGISYNLIQTLCAGKRDIQFTSLMGLIESLDISFTEFAKLYDEITSEQIHKEKEEIEVNKSNLKKKKI